MGLDILHCPDRGLATRVFLLLAFSTARHGAGLRAVLGFARFSLPATGIGYARFPTSRLFHCPDECQATSFFPLLSFYTARHEAGIRAVFLFSLFPLPAMGPGYAHFLIFHFSHCPSRDRATRGFPLLYFSTARRGSPKSCSHYHDRIKSTNHPPIMS